MKFENLKKSWKNMATAVMIRCMKTSIKMCMIMLQFLARKESMVYNLIMKLVETSLRVILYAIKCLPKNILRKINGTIMWFYDSYCLRENVSPIDTLQRIVNKQGSFHFEAYDLVTSNGMPLQIHRLRNNSSDQEISTPIFLQHGLLGSSADFLLEGGMAYTLADAGKDVWLGNFRGSIFSRRSLREPINDKQFWGYCIDHHGSEDLPTMINFVLKETQQEQIIYIGHSMGATALFIMCNLHPNMTSKIKEAHLLAPVTDCSVIQGLPKYCINTAEYLMQILELLGIYTIFFPRMLKGYSIIALLMFQVVGYNSFDIDNNFDRLKDILKFAPSGFTTKTFFQYARCNKKKQLVSAKYDGCTVTYVYSLECAKFPTVIYWAENDYAAGRCNIERLLTDLPNVVGVYELYNNYGHVDFTWSDDRQMNRLLHRLIIEKQIPYINSTNECQKQRSSKNIFNVLMEMESKLEYSFVHFFA